MIQNTYSKIIQEQTKRALWEVGNVIDCVPQELWNKEYCQMPLWKHIYHMLHSLDVWFVNPFDSEYREPYFHTPDLNNLDVVSEKSIDRQNINKYFAAVRKKVTLYTESLCDKILLEFPEKCEYTRFTLIMAQMRHLHSHMGMIMGFIIEDTGKWPAVLGLTKPFPDGEYNKYC